MRIDAHQHFWRYSPAQYPWIGESMASLRRDFLPGDLAPLLRASGFDASIAVQASQSLDDTRFLLSLADDHPLIAGVVGWVDLSADDVREELATCAAHSKLVGVRHIVHDEPDDRFLLREDFCRGIAQLAEFDLTYDILIFPRHLPVAIEFVSRFPSQRFVLDHLAKPQIRSGEIRTWAQGLRELAQHPNLWAKLSGLVTEASWTDWTVAQIRPYLDVAFECFGADRLMIGSDWPVCTVAADFGQTMNVVIEYLDGRSAAEREAVLGGTAARFWQLPRDVRAGDAGT
jgi:L-fuconolactonase